MLAPDFAGIVAIGSLEMKNFYKPVKQSLLNLLIPVHFSNSWKLF